MLLTLMALLLVGAESDSRPNDTSPATPTTQLSSAPSTGPSSPFCRCHTPTTPPSSVPPTPPPSAALGVITVAWDRRSCEGRVLLSFLSSSSSSSSSSAVCHGSGVVREVLRGLCEQTRGCGGVESWAEGSEEQRGYNVTWQGSMKESSCRSLMVHCTVLAEGSSELIGYKVSTGLLCVVLLAGIIILFTKPSVRALQRRMSDRRQSRWVGPTHCHSVSYHRGKAAVQNDTDMSLSYPALERLAVSASREPSSNRNSDYDY